jgi:hypothetical protein
MGNPPVAPADTLPKSDGPEVGNVRRGRATQQGGFIRGVLWVGLTVLVVAVIALDAVSLYAAHEKVQTDTDDAARQARQVLVQELSVGRAEQAARRLLEGRGDELLELKTKGTGEQTVFIVSATRHANTYLFRYLRYVPGLEGWVERTMDPTATGRSD